MIQLIEGDTLATLKAMGDGSVDIVVTSPPYNTMTCLKGKRTGLMKEFNFMNKVKLEGYPDDVPEIDYQKWLIEVVGECLRVAKGLVWINHKVRYRQQEAIHPARMLPFPIYSEVIWDRGSTLALNCYKYAPSHEVIYGFGKKHYWDRQNDMRMSVWRIMPEKGINHPCPYPVEIPRRLISSSCPPGGIVLDPFNGSGTTGLAAIELGRGYIGIDREKRYLELTRERLGMNDNKIDFEETAA